MAEQQPLEAPKRPSFAGTVISGITGFFKGAFTGGLTGAIGGAALAAAAAGVAMLIMEPAALVAAVPLLGFTGSTAAATAIVGSGALFAVPTVGAVLGSAATTGAALGGTLLGAIGAVAGTVTGVVKNREANQPTAEDVVNVAKISFAQGVNVGAHLKVAEQPGQAKASTRQQDMIKAERATAAMAEAHVIN